MAAAAPPQSSAAGAGGDSSSAATSLGFGSTTASNSLLISSARLHAHSTFLANDTPILIVPQFNYRTTLGLISQPVGPFVAGVATPVPLWLACYLRRRNLCRIVPPEWMDVEALREVLKHERNPAEGSFSSALPFRYAEIGRAVLAACTSGSGSGAAEEGGEEVEMSNPDQVRLLLEDIATVRMDKIRRNVHTLSAHQMATDDVAALPVIDVTGIGSLEMATVRDFVLTAFGDHGTLIGRKVDKKKDSESRSEQQQRRGMGKSRIKSKNRSVATAAAEAATARRSSSGGGSGRSTTVVDAPAVGTASTADNTIDDTFDDMEEEDQLEEPTREATDAAIAGRASTSVIDGGRSRIRRFR